MKVMNWNIEWMNNWFSGNHEPRWGSGSLSAEEAQHVAEKVARVIRRTSPDIHCVQEGPSAAVAVGSGCRLAELRFGQSFGVECNWFLA